MKSVRVDAKVILEPADTLPPRTITRGAVVVRMNRVIDAAGALRLSGSGMDRLFISFAEHRLLSHADFARQLLARPIEDDEQEACGVNRLFVFGRRVRGGDTRLLVLCAEEIEAIGHWGDAVGEDR